MISFWFYEKWLPLTLDVSEQTFRLILITDEGLRTGSHFDISISRHTKTQYDVDNQRLWLYVSLIKGQESPIQTDLARLIRCLLHGKNKSNLTRFK